MIACVLNGVFAIFSLMGWLCFNGLARGYPIRGAIDVAWGTEVRVGEFYGAAVSNAYDLESKVAQYPRIVVSNETVNFLEVNSLNPAEDSASVINRELAKLCIAFLAQDKDGYRIINYLGGAFREAVLNSTFLETYEPAANFVAKSLAEARKNQDTKLTPRYEWLLEYFVRHTPPEFHSSPDNEVKAPK